MSVQSDQRDTEFRQWKQALDDRCAAHLLRNPEYVPGKPAYSEKWNQVSLPPAPSYATRVEVREGWLPGSWSVYQDGQKVHTFFGDYAQQAATKFAGDLINKL